MLTSEITREFLCNCRPIYDTDTWFVRLYSIRDYSRVDEPSLYLDFELLFLDYANHELLSSFRVVLRRRNDEPRAVQLDRKELDISRRKFS